MINQVILVGKVKGIENYEEHKKALCIEIDRPFKDTYNRESDLIECVFWDSIFKKVISSCRDGDLVALRGRIENNENKFNVVVENVVLLNKSRDNLLKIQ